jgi:hypothetical protein
VVVLRFREGVIECVGPAPPVGIAEQRTRPIVREQAATVETRLPLRPLYLVQGNQWGPELRRWEGRGGLRRAAAALPRDT